MTIKQTVSLTTLPTANEQTGVSPLTVTATGNSREYRELGAYSRGIFFLDVTSASGTPTLTVALQVQDPQSLKWSQVFAFPAQTGVTGATPLTPVTADLYGCNYRLAWTVSGGTPSITFSCTGVVGAEIPIC